MRIRAIQLRHLRALQVLAMLVAPLTGCTGDKKVWIVVDIKMSDGKLTRMSFEDPGQADVDVESCEQSLKGAASILMQEIHGMPETKRSHFVSAKCVQSDENPAASQ
jgi:hypothetical protein